MAKGIIIFMLISILLAGTIYAQTTTQQVTVTVVSGFLNVYSPVEGKIYQKNLIPVIANITTPLDIDTVSLMDNNVIIDTCAKCKQVSKEIYFSDGEHTLTVRARFKSGDIIEKSVSFFVDSSSDIYILANAGLKKATAKDVVDYLFHYNFTLIHKNEMAPDDACSVRAKNGNATMNGITFGNKNSLNFYSKLSLESGEGEIQAQNKGKYYGYRFKVNKVFESSNTSLKMEIFDKKSKNFGILEFDKSSGKARVSINNLSIEKMNAFSVKGCSERKGDFYYLEKGNRADRSIEEVRQLLTDNPVLISRFSNLQFLFANNWNIKRVLGLY